MEKSSELDPRVGEQIVTASPSLISRLPTRRIVAHLALLVIAVALVFSNTLPNGLYLDDTARVQGNPEIRQFWPPWRHFFDHRTNSGIQRIAEYRPMLPLSLSADVVVSRAFGFERSRIHHLGNLLVHLASCVLLYLLFRHLLLHWSRLESTIARRLDLAFAACLLWAVHPVSGVPINYVCSRDLQLMFFFLLASLLVYMRMRHQGENALRWAGALGLLALALASKQNAAVMPALVFGFEFLVARSSLRSWRTWARPLPFATVVGGFLVWTRFVVGNSPVAAGLVKEPLAYSATQIKLHVFYYLRNAFWPFQMRLLPDVARSKSLFEPAVVVGLFFLVASVILVLALRRRAPVASWSIAAYWILFSPTSLFAFRPMNYLATDYRQYPSLAFFCLLLVLSLDRVRLRAVATAIAMALALYLGISAFWTNRVWRTGESLYGHAVRLGTRPVAEMNYAMAVQSRDPMLAEKHYLAVLRKSPGSPFPYINLGLLYMRLGKTAEGLLLIQLGVDHGASWAGPHHWLAAAYRSVGRLDDARRQSVIAADLDPGQVDFQYQAGLALQQAGEVSRSLEYLGRVTRLNPSHKDALFLEAFALQRTGRWPLAEQKYRQFLSHKPRHPKAWINLGQGLTFAGRCQGAIEAFSTVLSLKQGFERQAHRGLATCYEALGNHKLQERHTRLSEAPEGT